MTPTTIPTTILDRFIGFPYHHRIIVYELIKTGSKDAGQERPSIGAILLYEF
jgi:hypothetical protein